jgi:hypothetical protein
MEGLSYPNKESRAAPAHDAELFTKLGKVESESEQNQGFRQWVYQEAFA